MSTTALPLWVREFGQDYDVPATIALAEGIEDTSWGNDSCPSFGITVNDVYVQLWVEHPDRSLREYFNDRFVVTASAHDAASIALLSLAVPGCLGDHTEGETDDATEAVSLFMNLLTRVYRARS